MKNLIVIAVCLFATNWCFGQFTTFPSQTKPGNYKEKKPKKQKTYEVYKPTVVQEYKPHIVSFGSSWTEDPLKGDLVNRSGVKIKKVRYHTSSMPKSTCITTKNNGRVRYGYKIPLTVPSNKTIKAIKVDYYVGNYHNKAKVNKIQLMKARRNYGDLQLDSSRSDDPRRGKLTLQSDKLRNQNDLYLEFDISSWGLSQVIIEEIKVLF